jgi:hypothetical protein
VKRTIQERLALLREQSGLTIRIKYV